MARTADATVVVLVPGTGDDVQAMKAGIMEIADVFVANKADREGIDRLVQSIEAALSLQPAAAGRVDAAGAARPRRRPGAASTSSGPRCCRFRERSTDRGRERGALARARERGRGTGRRRAAWRGWNGAAARSCSSRPSRTWPAGASIPTRRRTRWSRARP